MYRFGMGDLTVNGQSCTPKECPGPYSNPQSNYEVAQNQQSGGVVTQAYASQYSVNAPGAGASCIDYDTATAAAGVGISPCQDRDQACISARDAAVQNFEAWWTSTPGNCHSLSDVPKFTGPSTIPSGDSPAQLQTPSPVSLSATAAAPATTSTNYISSALPTSSPSKYISSSAATTAPSSTAASVPAAPANTGFDISSIPWWGWAIAAGAALLAFGKH